MTEVEVTDEMLRALAGVHTWGRYNSARVIRSMAQELIERRFQDGGAELVAMQDFAWGKESA